MFVSVIRILLFCRLSPLHSGSHVEYSASLSYACLRALQQTHPSTFKMHAFHQLFFFVVVV